MATARMDEIQRQKDPMLKEAVELAAKGRLRPRSIASEHQPDRERPGAAGGRRKGFHPAPGRARSDADRLRNERSKAEINRMVREDLRTAGRAWSSIPSFDVTRPRPSAGFPKITG